MQKLFTMQSSSKNQAGGNESIHQTPSEQRNNSSAFLHELPSEQIKEALVDGQKNICPLDEMICASEAAFAIARYSEISMELKNAFYRLEKQFEMYKRLAGRC